jgi:lysophospholipase L1-like esterase
VRRRWVGNLLVLVATLALMFSVAEVASALFLPPPIVWRYPQESYVRDPRLLHRLKPGQHAFTHSVPAFTNSHGLRNEEFSVTPAAGTVRVLCLGDSLTFGKGVALAETYPKQLEAILNAAGAGRYEVINAGVSAYDTWQEVAYLGDVGWRFQPHVVVVGFYANDIVPRPLAPTPPATEADDVMTSNADRAVYWLKRSRVLLFLRERVTQLRNRIRPSPEVRHTTALLRGTTDELVEAGWREIDAAFEELARLAALHRFATLVVFFPLADQVSAPYPNASYPSRARALAARHGIPTIDLLPAFRRAFSGLGSLFLEWDGHPNARAYAIAAREIGDHVRAHAR